MKNQLGGSLIRMCKMFSGCISHTFWIGVFRVRDRRENAKKKTVVKIGGCINHTDRQDTFMQFRA